MRVRVMAFWATLAGLIALGGPALLQDRLLYFPQRAAVADMAQGGLQPWPAAEDFRGLLAPVTSPVRATALVFHGNAGHAGQRAFYAEALGPLGVRVVLAEYPGYGPRDGELGETSLVADAARSIERAFEQFGPPLLVVGESLGAGVAAAAAARQQPRVAALLLITPWDSLTNLASFHYPWLPVRWLLRDRYDSVAHLGKFRGPVAVVVAGRDDIVPARFGEALYGTLAGPRQLERLPAAGHNDWPLHVDDRWWQQRIDFLLPATPAR